MKSSSSILFMTGKNATKRCGHPMLIVCPQKLWRSVSVIPKIIFTCSGTSSNMEKSIFPSRFQRKKPSVEKSMPRCGKKSAIGASIACLPEKSFSFCPKKELKSPFAPWNVFWPKQDIQNCPEERGSKQALPSKERKCRKPLA